MFGGNDRGDFFQFDFASKDYIRKERVPIGPTAIAILHNVAFLITVDDEYSLPGVWNQAGWITEPSNNTATKGLSTGKIVAPPELVATALYTIHINDYADPVPPRGTMWHNGRSAREPPLRWRIQQKWDAPCMVLHSDGTCGLTAMYKLPGFKREVCEPQYRKDNYPIVCMPPNWTPAEGDVDISAMDNTPWGRQYGRAEHTIDGDTVELRDTRRTKKGDVQYFNITDKGEYFANAEGVQSSPAPRVTEQPESRQLGLDVGWQRDSIDERQPTKKRKIELPLYPQVDVQQAPRSPRYMDFLWRKEEITKSEQRAHCEEVEQTITLMERQKVRNDAGGWTLLLDGLDKWAPEDREALHYILSHPPASKKVQELLQLVDQHPEAKDALLHAMDYRNRRKFLEGLVESIDNVELKAYYT